MKTSYHNKLLSVGVDVGTTNGALAIITEDLDILLLTKTPTYQTLIKSKRNKDKLNKETGMYEKDYRKRTWVDFKKVGDLLVPYLSAKVIYTVERIAPRPQEGEPSSFVNGNALGIFQAMSSLLSAEEYYEPTPIEWKKDMGVTSDKETSIKLTEDIYQIKLRDYLKKGKLDDIAEALLLAFYGLKQYLSKGDK